MDKKILVAYGSKRGSTAEIAEKIGETLRLKGLQVDVLDAGTVNDLTPYSKIILGSSVYIGLWHKKAVLFLKKPRGYKRDVASFLDPQGIQKQLCD